MATKILAYHSYVKNLNSAVEESVNSSHLSESFFEIKLFKEKEINVKVLVWFFLRQITVELEIKKKMLNLMILIIKFYS